MVKRAQALNVGVSAEELASISSPPKVSTPFGSFEFFDGLPLPDTVDLAYDTLDLLRGIDVFLDCVPGASMLADADRVRRRSVSTHRTRSATPTRGPIPRSSC